MAAPLMSELLVDPSTPLPSSGRGRRHRAEIGCHTFRATGITAYLANGGALEHAQEMAVHGSPRTTKLYDGTKERHARRGGKDRL